MRQAIMGGYADSPASIGSEYNNLCGGTTWNTGPELKMSQIVTTPGNISFLWVEMVSPPGVGKTFTYTLMVNGAASSLTCSITGGGATDISSSDTAHRVAVVAGDRVSLRATNDGIPSTSNVRWACRFVGDNPRESLILGGALSADKTGNRYGNIYGSDTTSSVENYGVQIIPTPGKMKNLYIAMVTDPGSGAEAYRYTLRKNGADTGLTLTISAGSTTGNETSVEVTFAAGDKVSLLIEPQNSPTNTSNFVMGLTFVADTDGEAIVMGGNGQGQTAVRYLPLAHTSASWESTEIDASQENLVGVFKKLYVWMQTAPASGKSWDVALMKDAVATDLAVNIADTATTGNDTTNVVSSFNGDEIDVRVTPNNSPDTTLYIKWSAVSVHGGVFPSDPLARVTGIIRRFSEGNYSSEVSLGGLSASFGVPRTSAQPETVIPPAGDEPVFIVSGPWPWRGAGGEVLGVFYVMSDGTYRYYAAPLATPMTP